MKRIITTFVLFISLILLASCTGGQEKQISSFTATAEIYCTATNMSFTSLITESGMTLSGGSLYGEIYYSAAEDTLTCGNVTLPCNITEDSVFNLPHTLKKMIINGSKNKAEIQYKNFIVKIQFGDVK